nr:acyl-CoA dehydrogenase family protein [Nocardioides panaciterrulae]
MTEDQRDLQAMLGGFAADHDVVLADDPDTVGGLVAALAELGVWTLGVAEEHGGGGADRTTTAVALVQLGRCWPALALAAAQAHAAAGLLGGDERCAELLGRLHAGGAAVAVVDAGSAHVRLHRTPDRLRGSIDRVDAAAEAPYVLVLAGDDTALLVDPAACRFSPVRRTGLGGALTRSVEVDADAAADALVVLTGVDVPAARAELRVGIAAAAAGIAAAAADDAAAYAAGRHQFGDALTAIPTVRQSLLAQASRTAVILDTVLAGRDADPVRSLATVREACDGALEVAAAALQSHGGYGYLAEYPAERHLRDAVSLRAAAALPGATVATARTLVGLAPAEVLTEEVT